MLAKGTIIHDRYEIVGRVGAGGMSDVYKAIDHKLNRNVAMKILKKEFSKDKNFVAKFRVEAQSAASLIHPNIVNVYDVGEDKGMYYIVMELIEGVTLKTYIRKKGSLSVKEATSIAIQIANGIECAHNNQIVHRDIKPQNIMISREGKVKVTDFGIARAASANTVNANAMGSVHYISPEQANGQYVDEKSDIYSLGITLFEMLTGNVPFDGDSTVAIALMHIKNNVPSVRKYLDNVPISLEKIILKCTQNKANNRYPKISALISDLKRSLVEPDVDFVNMDEVVDTSATIMITDEDAQKLTDAHSIVQNGDDEDDIDVENARTDKLLNVGGTIVGILALILITVLITAFVSGTGNKLPGSSNSVEVTKDPNKVEMPNVVGLSKEEAEATLHEQGLGFAYTSDAEFSEDYPRDYVIRQSEDPASEVNKNSTIELTLSKGPEKINVPEDIVGEKLSKVTAKLDELGLNWEINYEFSGREIDTVIDTYPAEKAPVNKKDIVKLTVSRGQNSTGEVTVTVPNVVGKKQSKAQATISAAGLGVGNVIEVENDKVKKGYVIRQIIKAGSIAPEGTSVGLIVSKGSKKDEKYTGTYTFAKDDLIDEEGKPIEKGAVSVLVNGTAQSIDSKYTNVAKWKGDYKIKVYGEEKGKADIELLIDGKIVLEDVVVLK